MPLLIIMCSMVFAIFIIFDLIPLFQQKKWKACWVYIILFCIAYAIHLMSLLGYEVPSPSQPIQKIVSYIFGLKD